MMSDEPAATKTVRTSPSADDVASTAAMLELQKEQQKFMLLLMKRQQNNLKRYQKELTEAKSKEVGEA